MPKQDSIPGLSQLLKCPICLGLLSAACDTNCGHAFCAPCILHHLKHSARCPLCREEITSAHPSYVLRAMVESYRSARTEASAGAVKDVTSGHAAEETAEKAPFSAGDSPSALPPGLGSSLRHSASMSSLSSLSSVDDDRYDALLREHTAATQVTFASVANESSNLLDINGNAATQGTYRPALRHLRKPVVIAMGIIAFIFLCELLVALLQWSGACPLFYPTLALTSSGLAWSGSTLVYLASTSWLGRGTRFQARAKQEAALFVVFTCFTAFVIFVSLPLPYCLFLEDCVTSCSGNLLRFMQLTTIVSWLLCLEILALLLPWIWLAWAVFGSFRIIVSLVTCRSDFCRGFYETNFRDWPSMGIATLEAVRGDVGNDV